MNSIKAVIFDADGLMIDTEKLHSEAHALVIKQYGKKPVKHPNGIVHIIGKSILENSEMIKKQYNIQESAEVLEKKKHEAYMHILQNKKIRPMLGLKKLVTTLKKNNIKIAIGTGGIRKALDLILENINMANTFDAIVALGDVKRLKPFPDTYLEAAKLLGVTPKECVVLEDSQTGVEAAWNAKMKVIAIPNKWTKHQNLSKADLIINSLNKINMKVLESL